MSTAFVDSRIEFKFCASISFHGRVDGVLSKFNRFVKGVRFLYGNVELGNSAGFMLL